LVGAADCVVGLSAVCDVGVEVEGDGVGIR